MVILPHRQADGNLLLGVPVRRSGARTGVDVFFRRGPLSSDTGSAAVGKKIEGRKMKETESSFLRPPIFLPAQRVCAVDCRISDRDFLR
jgi:hypothetical protein